MKITKAHVNSLVWLVPTGNNVKRIYRSCSEESINLAKKENNGSYWKVTKVAIKNITVTKEYDGRVIEKVITRYNSRNDLYSTDRNGNSGYQAFENEAQYEAYGESKKLTEKINEHLKLQADNVDYVSIKEALESIENKLSLGATY